jgi:hypothetical protein
MGVNLPVYWYLLYGHFQMALFWLGWIVVCCFYRSYDVACVYDKVESAFLKVVMG